MKPVIGISAHFKEQNHMLNTAYVEAIYRAGAYPVIIPVINDEEMIEQYLDELDGLLLSGGGDMDASFWGEEKHPQADTPNKERDAYDLLLTKHAALRQLPILGICRGMQVINVAFGGDIYQDIYAQIGKENVIGHSQKMPMTNRHHDVNINKQSKLYQIMQVERSKVNSLHHQVVRRIPFGFTVVAESTQDHLCEAIEHPHYPIIGVQWHPEHLALNRPEHAALFNWLITEAAIMRQAKHIHTLNITIDSHCDTPMVWYTDINLNQRQKNTQVDFRRMKDGHIDVSCMVAYLPQEDCDPISYEKAFNDANQIFDNLKQQISNHSDYVAQITRPCEMVAAKNQGKSGILFGIENGFALAHKIKNITHFYQKGVRYITLCHNGDNDLCDSAKSIHTHGGLSEFGKEVIQEMNRLGMLIDIAHASSDTISQAIDYSDQPIISSHSCARTLCDHPRNISDELLRKLAVNGGLCQLCLYSGFLKEEGQASLQDAITHIKHMVNVMGEDHVGIGSDFDGGGGVNGCNSTNELINITKELIKIGYKPERIQKIMGGNFRRIFQQVTK